MYVFNTYVLIIFHILIYYVLPINVLLFNNILLETPQLNRDCEYTNGILILNAHRQLYCIQTPQKLLQLHCGSRLDPQQLRGQEAVSHKSSLISQSLKTKRQPLNPQPLHF